MTLQDFEKHIDSTILKRGKAYFLEGNVEFIEEIKKNNWAADVVGTDDYQIEIQLGSKGEIKSSECSCPYDYGAFCKHIVAVLYAIEEQKTMDLTPKKTANKTTASKNITFDKLLLNIAVNEYQEFVKHYSKINKSFKDAFELYFAEKNPSFDLEKKYSDLVKKTIKIHTSRGFIDYAASNKLGKELQQYIVTAQQYLVHKNYRDAFALSKVLIREVCPVFGYCDDSNGYVADCASQAIDFLPQLYKANVSIEFKEQIADFIKEELQKKIYFQYGNFGYDLTILYAEISIIIHKTNDFIAFIDAKIEQSKKYDYEKKFFIQQKIVFLNELGQKSQVEELIQENLEVSEIRAIEINRLIEQKEYEQAKQLLAEGIKIAEKKNHAGTVYQWEKELLRIAHLEKHIDMIRFFAKKFAFDRGVNTEYYNQWKKTYSKEEWEAIIEEVIQAITTKINEVGKKYVSYNPHVLNSNMLFHLAPIYIFEKYLDRLLELIQKEQSLENILAYYPYLKSQYPSEIQAVLLPALERQGEQSEGRSQYKYLAKKMQFIIKDFPEAKEKILEVSQKLKTKYPRRPAMLEELNKLF